MRWLIILLLLLPSAAMADPVAVGYNRWKNDNNTHTSTIGNHPRTYAEEGVWDDIVPDWVVVNDTTAKVVRGNHRLFAFGNGNIYYVRPRSGVRHCVGIRPVKLVKFNKLDSTYVTLADADYDSVSLNGPVLTYHDIFPGVNRRCIYDNLFYSDQFVFSQQGRDTLGEYGPWADKMVGIISRLDIDSLNLSMKDRAGTFTPDEDGRDTEAWVMCHKNDTSVLALQQAYLVTEDSTTSVKVHKRVVVQAGKIYLVELFNPIPTASWPSGPIWHNAEIGYDTNFATGLDIESKIAGMSIAALSVGGTADSMQFYGDAASLNIDGRMALYSDDGAGGYAVVDSTAVFTIDRSGFVWHPEDFLLNATLSAGTRYMPVVWGETDGFGATFAKYRTANTAQAADSFFYDGDDDGTGGWSTIVQEIMSDWQRPVSIIAFYTEDVAAGQVIIIGNVEPFKEDYHEIFKGSMAVCCRPTMGW